MKALEGIDQLRQTERLEDHRWQGLDQIRFAQSRPDCRSQRWLPDPRDRRVDRG